VRLDQDAAEQLVVGMVREERDALGHVDGLAGAVALDLLGQGRRQGLVEDEARREEAGA